LTPLHLVVLSLIPGFLLGGIPSGLWIGRSRGVDLRTVGSRNIGATNAYRILGARWGIAVFVLDALKGASAAWLAGWIAAWLRIDDPHARLYAALAGGIAAIAGHVFSPWLGFRGGRGVATSLGVFLAIVPVPSLLAFGLWIVLVALSRRVSVGSIGAAMAYPVLVLLLLRGAPDRMLLVAVSTLVAILVIVRHRANIERLLAGTEPPILGRKAGERP